MKIMKHKMISLIIIFSLMHCSSEQVKEKPISPFLDTQGHRGARGLKPENTIPAFETAMQYGMRTIELDTVVTKDKKLIVHHDTETNPVICRNSDGTAIVSRKISELTVSELKNLDCGSLVNPKFPEQKAVPGTKLSTLDEFFQSVKDYEKKNKVKTPFLFNVETKFDKNPTEEQTKEFAALMTEYIRKAGVVDRTAVQSFHLPVLPEVRKIEPKLKLSALVEPGYFGGLRMYLGLGAGVRKSAILAAEELKVDVLSPYHLYVTEEFVREAHKRKIQVIPWTVNETDLMKSLLEKGVDGIISDYPDRLSSVAEKK